MNTNPIKHSILKYNTLMPKLSFVKKKDKLIIIDGYINYEINKKELSCPCSKFLCEHIIYFLTQIVNINIEKLIFYNKIKKELITLLGDSNHFSIIDTKINNIIDTECECIICMCNVKEKKFNTSIVECSNCHNYCHKYCFDLYKSKNGLLSDICIYCKTGNMG
jgi:hypothetical protein